MASEITLYTHNRTWKAEVEAWKNNFLFYKSIGTQVTVYHLEQNSWVKKPASSIYIRNVYRGTIPGSVTRETTGTNTSYCELKEWAVGVNLTLRPDNTTSVGGGAVLDINSVEGNVTIYIAGEALTGQVSAGSIVKDTSIW